MSFGYFQYGNPSSLLLQQDPVADMMYSLNSPDTHRFFGTKPPDYAFWNPRFSRCRCNRRPPPCFLSDENGRWCNPPQNNGCLRSNWSDYLTETYLLDKECSRRKYYSRQYHHRYCPKIPRFYKKTPKKSKTHHGSVRFVNAEIQVDEEEEMSADDGEEEEEEEEEKPEEEEDKDLPVCKCKKDALSEQLENDPSLRQIDMGLTPFERQLELGIRNLRQRKPPTIWILGYPSIYNARNRRNFGISLATRLGYQYIDVDDEMLRRMNATEDELDHMAEEFTKENDPIKQTSHAKILLMTWRLLEEDDTALSDDGVLELLKLVLTHYHSSPGFVIDSFPCSENEAIGFEAMFYPATYAIYVRPNLKNESPKGNGKNTLEDELEDNKSGVSGIDKEREKECKEDPQKCVEEPANFRRDFEYSEKGVEAVMARHKDNCLVFEEGAGKLKRVDVERAANLILDKVNKEGKVQEKKRRPSTTYDMAGSSPCYNPYCDCHIVQDEKRNTDLQRDEEAINRIVTQMRQTQEEFNMDQLKGLELRSVAGEDDEDEDDEDVNPSSSMELSLSELPSSMIETPAIRDRCERNNGEEPSELSVVELPTSLTQEEISTLFRRKSLANMDDESQDAEGLGDFDEEDEENLENDDEDDEEKEEEEEEEEEEKDDEEEEEEEEEEEKEKDEDDEGSEEELDEGEEDTAQGYGRSAILFPRKTQ